VYKVAKWIASVIWKIISPIFEAIKIILEEIYYAIGSLFGVRRNP
jgi:phage-related protein